MTLSTYGGLKAALARLLDRDDLAQAIPDFVALFEAGFDADPRTARHRRRICRSTAQIANEYETLPTNYLAVQSAALETEPVVQLSYVDPDALVRMKQEEGAWRTSLAADFGAASAPPRFYSIVGTEIRFFPAPQTGYTCDLTIYERLDALVEDGQTNWLLSFFPNLYLYGAALHSAPYLGADERLATWQGLNDQALEALMASDPAPTSKTPLRTEVARVRRVV